MAAQYAKKGKTNFQDAYNMNQEFVHALISCGAVTFLLVLSIFIPVEASFFRFACFLQKSGNKFLNFHGLQKNLLLMDMEV